MRYAIAVVLLVPFLVLSAPKAKKASVVETGTWVEIMNPDAWQLAKGYRQACTMWQIADSSFEGTDSWIGYDSAPGDFVLEGEFLYNGTSQGGVVIRGDRESWIPWLSGYEMDIDAGELAGEGRIHFPCRPQPNPGQARFTVGVWQRFSITAIGASVAVKLNGKEVIRFTDDHYRYGQICLEGFKGGVRYRNMRFKRLDTKPPEGARSPWLELFDGTTLTGWGTTGDVAVVSGVIEIDGNKRSSGIQLQGHRVMDGVFEVDVWCRRRANLQAAYRTDLRVGAAQPGACFICRSSCVVSCGPACTSQFPMYQATDGPEYWRFDLRGRTIQAYRFGEKVLTCTDTAAAPGAIAFSADSCMLKVRGVRYRTLESLPVVTPVASKKAKKQ